MWRRIGSANELENRPLHKRPGKYFRRLQFMCKYPDICSMNAYFTCLVFRKKKRDFSCPAGLRFPLTEWSAASREGQHSGGCRLAASTRVRQVGSRLKCREVEGSTLQPTFTLDLHFAVYLTSPVHIQLPVKPKKEEECMFPMKAIRDGRRELADAMRCAQTRSQERAAVGED